MLNPANLPENLAIDGGQPVFPDSPPDWPLPDEDVLAAMQAAYASGDWGRYHGPYVQQLENDLAQRHGTEHAMCVCSGTVAVELALRALKVTADDEVILAGYDFPGNFRAIEAVGAKPVLVDISPANWCLSLAELDAAIGTKARAIIVSHLHGGLAPIREICQWAAQHGIGVVEDACQATGATVQGRVAGSWGDVGVLSFGGSKLLTAGRGGAVLTNRADVFQRCKIHNDRGNATFPMSELQAAVLLPQLARLDERNRRRREFVDHLLKQLQGQTALRPIQIAAGEDRPSFYKLAWLFHSDSDSDAAGGVDRERFIAAVRAEGVAIDAGFRGFARRTARRCRKVSELSASRQAAENTVLLHHPILLQECDVADRVARAIIKVLQHLSH